MTTCAPRRRAAKRSPRARPLETPIVRTILEALRWDYRVLVWRQNTGVARYKTEDGSERVVRYGVPGAADITGLVRGTGRRLEIEVKRDGKSKPSAEQIHYAKLITAASGIYLLVTSLDDARRQLDEVLGRTPETPARGGLVTSTPDPAEPPALSTPQAAPAAKPSKRRGAR